MGNPLILTKAHVIEEICQVVGIPRKEAAVILERILDSMVRAIGNGDKVEIRGFGSFRTRQRRTRIARNPKTGALVQVPAKKIAFFKPSKDLRELVEKI
jgi:integration host factor subunit beta